jgi:hypothetical protein
MSVTNDWVEFTVAELHDRAGEEAFRLAGTHVVDLDGPHEDEWSLYATVSLDDGQVLETILHHRAGKPLAGECTCTQARTGAFCSHLVWVGLVHLGLDASPRIALAAETASPADLRPWLATLSRDDLVSLVLDAAHGDPDYCRRLHLRAHPTNQSTP